MRKMVFLIFMVCSIALCNAATVPTLSAGGVTNKEVAVVDFPEQVKLLGVFLKGQYLFVHDDARMARGEACTYVYTLKDGKPDKLVVSFHCTPAERQTAKGFVVKTILRSKLMAIREITEIQFPGSSEAHLVPAS
ncbi:MAG: hypothetical protein M3362_20305 [Acidobacteriota bacterium]|nr:hypothetical protein [Acidobacteriota bacterium]